MSGFVELRRVLVNAIFRPSRENVGSLSSPIAVVNRVGLEPFVELMLQRSWPEPPARLLARMILVESGDQAGSFSACFVAVSCKTPLPFVFIVQTFSPMFLSLTNAILVPSGAQAGSLSMPLLFVSRVGLDPFAFIE